MTPAELRAHLAAGALLSFPVTAMDAAGAVDVGRLREHVRHLLDHRPGGLFVCGGTGEFPALTFAEWRAATAAAVAEAAARVPVLAGAGYGTAVAREYVRAAEALGCDGVLVLPPYLGEPDQEGLYAHCAAVADGARIGVVVYQRDNAVFSPDTVAALADLPAIAGFKDGRGDVERLQRIALLTEGALPLLNGLPTAEMSQPALGAAGARSYSSAVFNFVPELAQRFYAAWRSGDSAGVADLLRSFYLPFCALRDRRRGYAVSLIKAGLELVGRPCGTVRSPLVPPGEADVAVLRGILERNGVRVAA